MHRPPGSTGRPRFDIAAIVRAHREELRNKHGLGPAEGHVLSAIALCRTPALGGHLDVCRSCGHEQPAYNSCRNRHCPKCQALAQERWIAARAERLLPARHFHVVFTLPAQLRPLCQHAPRAMYDALFETATDTLLELTASRWRALPGITSVLHTWTREMWLHPHVHMLVTAGGLALVGERWRHRRTYLFPLDMMANVFRAKMLDALRLLRRQGTFAGYPHRVALSNSRLLDVFPAAVTFRTRGEQTTTLTPVEFLRRFVQHVLSDGFHKIRHHGLYASASAQSRWPRARALLTSAPTPVQDADKPPRPTSPPTWQEHLLTLTGRDVRRCRRCGGLALPEPLARAPPAVAA